MNPSKCNSRANSICCRPLGYCFNDFSDFNSVIIASIVGLRNSVAPLAVFFAVVSVYVFSIYGVMNRGRQSHICQKVFESFPSVSVCDSTSTIVAKPIILRIFATPSNIAPSSITFPFQGIFSVGHSVGFIWRRASQCTSATNSISTKEMACEDSLYVAAITNTFPFGRSFMPAMKASDFKLSEPMSNWSVGVVLSHTAKCH